MDELTAQVVAEAEMGELGVNQNDKKRFCNSCHSRQRPLPGLIIFCMAVYEITEALLKTSTRLHILRLSCIHVTNDSEFCRREANKTAGAEVDLLIHNVAAPYIISYTVLMNGPTTISCLFLGSWSDRHGRKKVLLLPLAGQIFACIFFSFSFIPRINKIPGGTVCLLVGVFIYGVCGKSTVFLIGASSYVTDCSTNEERTRLLSRLIGVGFFGNCIGYALVSLLSLFITFQWVLVAVSFTALTLFITITIFIRETLKCQSSKPLHENPPMAYGLTGITEEEDEGHAAVKEASSKLEVCENTLLVSPEKGESNSLCFTIAHIIHFLSRSRDRSDRVHIMLLLCCCFISHMVKVGENDAVLLYVTREGVGWDEKIYGAYLSANYVAMSLQLLVVYPLLEKFLQPLDETCIIFGASVRILTFAATGLTSKTSLLFVYSLLGSFGAFVTCAGRSSLTKLASEEEIGMVLALTSFLEVLSATIGSSLFTEIFVATRQYFAGTVFFTLAAAQGCILISVLCSRCFERLSGPRNET